MHHLELDCIVAVQRRARKMASVKSSAEKPNTALFFQKRGVDRKICKKLHFFDMFSSAERRIAESRASQPGAIHQFAGREALLYCSNEFYDSEIEKRRAKQRMYDCEYSLRAMRNQNALAFWGSAVCEQAKRH